MDSNKDASISSLVNSAITDTQDLVKAQIELAKAEVTQSAQQAAAASALFVGAAVLGFLAFIFGLVAAAYGLVAAGLAEWAGFLIVAGVLVLVGLILAAVGRSRTKRVGPPVRAKVQLEQTKSALSGISGTVPTPGSEVAPRSDSAVAGRLS